MFTYISKYAQESNIFLYITNVLYINKPDSTYERGGNPDVYMSCAFDITIK